MRALDSQFFKARCDNADYSDVRADEPRLEYGGDILFQLSSTPLPYVAIGESRQTYGPSAETTRSRTEPSPHGRYSQAEHLFKCSPVPGLSVDRPVHF